MKRKYTTIQPACDLARSRLISRRARTHTKARLVREVNVSIRPHQAAPLTSGGAAVKQRRKARLYIVTSQLNNGTSE